jgi:ArsR family transcriptional regulator
VTVKKIGQWSFFKRNEAVIEAFLESLRNEL